MNDICQMFLKSDRVNKEEKDEIKKLTAEEIDADFGPSNIAFGTAGYRAVMGPGTWKLNHTTYGRLAFAYGTYILREAKKNNIEEPTCLVAHDNRLNGDKFTMTVAKVLSMMGIQVYLNDANDLLATPIVSFLVRDLGLTGAVIVTASHNPKEYNGFKIYDSQGRQLLPVDTDFIASSIPNAKDYLTYTFGAYFSEKRSFKFIKEAKLKQYYTEVAAAVKFKEGKRVVMTKKPVIFTSHHGTGSFTFPKFMSTVGANIKPVLEQCYPDPVFTNSPSSNPEDPKSFELALELAEKEKSDIILAVDPDSDRLGVAIKHENEWRYLNGNDTGTIISYYKLKYTNLDGKKPVIVSTYVSTNLIDRIAKDFGGRVIRTDTGFKWIGDAIDNLVKNDEIFIAGFEEAIGALTSTLNREKDSFQAAYWLLLIYSDIKSKGMTLIDYLQKEIYMKYDDIFTKTVQTIIKSNDIAAAGAYIKRKVAAFDEEYIGSRKIVEVKEYNGLVEWVLENDCNIKFRTSGTEPKYKIYFNLYGQKPGIGLYNSHQEELESEAKELTQVIQNYIAS